MGQRSWFSGEDAVPGLTQRDPTEVYEIILYIAGLFLRPLLIYGIYKSAHPIFFEEDESHRYGIFGGDAEDFFGDEFVLSDAL